MDCPSCDREFDTKRALRIHHTQTHGEKLGVKEVVCDWCGDTFERRKHRLEGLDHHFCSRDCDSSWRSKRFEGKKAPQWSRVETDCAHCGKEILVVKSVFESYESNFCSEKCQHLHQRNRTTVNCDNCGGIIERVKSEVSKRNFCDTSCRGEWWSENKSGENSPTWNGGTTRYYGASWQKARREALKRDNFKCVICGMTNEEHKEKHSESLHVHHIIGFTEYGLENHEEANRLSNLVTLCRRDHVKCDDWNLYPNTAKIS
jgi:5-methylcytosine-specific restriction endonuclease McrA